jgi:hypothetical protein
MGRGVPVHAKRHGRPCKNCGTTLKYGGPGATCVECSARRSRARKFDPSFKEVARRQGLRKRYGLTPERVAEILASQVGRCASCGTDEPGNANGWAIDHDHATGAVRGILCHGCNVGLGAFRDSIDRLQRAIRYLKRNGQGQLGFVRGGASPLNQSSSQAA